MTTQEALEKYAAQEKALFALQHAGAMIFYDGVTSAPKGSAGVRASTTGELTRMSYQLSTSPETIEIISTLASDIDSLDPIMKRKISEAVRSLERIRRVPEEVLVEYSQLSTESDAVWHEAKEKSDFAMFEPYLQRMFDMTKKIAQYKEPDMDPYDASMDDYERGLTRETCDAFFAGLRENLVPLINEVAAHADRVNDAPLKRIYPVEKQRKFSAFVMGLMGIDPDHCVLGETEHPFTIDFTRDDVRITTHYHEDSFASSMYSVIHEGGHALYELHTGRELAGSMLGGGASMAIHESQSRFYENIIGRSREFCSLVYPWLKREFAPNLDDVSEDDFYRMINKSEPSLIRTEADELTYCMHVMVRYELEKRMFTGELKAKDLPAEWNRMYKEYLGIDVPDDRRGVLQDSHWADGNIGYFPSYAIGSAYGGQYIERINRDFDLFAAVREGDFARINGWLEEHIWKFGRMLDPVPLFESVCGKFDVSHYVKYLRDKFSDVYRLG
ncbi:MAG: carboxypeptidase M32 [Clostridia bacterium]|nr:carboxypeptidase M32 [Clostridia bacterium]